ncbi:hypothetical protein WHZ78_15590 [Bradyrhizobium symbiodeficiens]|uniref:hypothetical protein n=1 Tax=Bradyrhizobium symbiodeficiens TaxID=1404367 RepID=UPI0030D521C8
MTDTNTNKRPEGLPHSGGPDLVRDSDGFLRSSFPASVQQSIAFRKACVREIVELEADRAFLLRVWHVSLIVRRARQRLGLEPDCRLPSLATLRSWRHADSDANRIALLRKFGPRACDGKSSGD